MCQTHAGHNPVIWRCRITPLPPQREVGKAHELEVAMVAETVEVAELALAVMGKVLLGRGEAWCDGHYNRMPDLGKCGTWWNVWDLAMQPILDTEVLDRDVTWLT